MKISDSTIVGHPIKVARDLMQHFRLHYISADSIKEFFDTLLWRQAVDNAIKKSPSIPRSLRSYDALESRRELAHIWEFSFKTMSKREARDLLTSLLDDGWIEINSQEDQSHSDEKYCLSDKGRQFSIKRLVPRISRNKADKLVREMIERIENINADPSLLDYVTKVVSFGSYVSDSDDVGDIDLCVTITRRLKNPEEHKKASKAFNEASGRRFSNFLDQLFYHQLVVKQQIKNRSPYISLHEQSDLELALVSKTLYEFSPPEN